MSVLFQSRKQLMGSVIRDFALLPTSWTIISSLKAVTRPFYVYCSGDSYCLLHLRVVSTCHWSLSDCWSQLAWAYPFRIAYWQPLVALAWILRWNLQATNYRLDLAANVYFWSCCPFWTDFKDDSSSRASAFIPWCCYYCADTLDYLYPLGAGFPGFVVSLLENQIHKDDFIVSNILSSDWYLEPLGRLLAHSRQDFDCKFLGKHSC